MASRLRRREPGHDVSHRIHSIRKDGQFTSTSIKHSKSASIEGANITMSGWESFFLTSLAKAYDSSSKSAWTNDENAIIALGFPLCPTITLVHDILRYRLY